jgi:hypothetical protein
MVFGETQYPRGNEGVCVLNATEIRKAKPKAAAYQLTDGLGLFLWVTPAGSKLWRWKYRHGGVQKTLSYGMYPDVSLEAARERHAAARKLLSDGIGQTIRRVVSDNKVRVLHFIRLTFDR